MNTQILQWPMIHSITGKEISLFMLLVLFVLKGFVSNWQQLTELIILIALLVNIQDIPAETESDN